MGKLMNLSGQKFGRLTVLRCAEKRNGQVYWLCMCDCGSLISARTSSLRSGTTSSCGCLRKEIAIKNISLAHKHKLSGTRLYRCWVDMKRRCYDKNHNGYKRYGGRGITVCDEWLNDVNAFHIWALSNGYNTNLTLERIDNNKGYSPENCTWATWQEQCRNRRSNVRIDYNGQYVLLAELSELTGIKITTLLSRYRKGDRGDMLFRPVCRLQGVVGK